MNEWSFFQTVDFLRARRIFRCRVIILCRARNTAEIKKQPPRRRCRAGCDSSHVVVAGGRSDDEYIYSQSKKLPTGCSAATVLTPAH